MARYLRITSKMQETPNKSNLEETEENIKNKQMKTSKQTTHYYLISSEKMGGKFLIRMRVFKKVTFRELKRAS